MRIHRAVAVVTVVLVVMAALSAAAATAHAALSDGTVTVVVGDCPFPGSPTRPVVVDIDPPNSVDVEVTGPDGTQYPKKDNTYELDLAPGHYSYEINDKDSSDEETHTFDVAPCPAPLKQSAVGVSVGACPAASSTTHPVTVGINPSGGASVHITGPSGYGKTVGSSGKLNLAAGSYKWTATAKPTYQLTGTKSGSFVAGSCVVEVKPRTFLPKTGANLPGLGAAGFGFILLGMWMVAQSRRPQLATSVPIVWRLRGRSSLAATMAPTLLYGVSRALHRRQSRHLSSRTGHGTRRRRARAGPGG